MVVLTGEVIQIISIVRSKVLYEIIVGSDAFGIVSLKEDLIGVISEFSLDIWNLKTKEKRKTLTVERVVAYVSQDSRLYIGSCDGKVWISNGDDIEFLFQVNQEIINLEVFDDYIAIVTKEGDLELRRISTKTCLASISIAGSISVGMWASSSTGLLQIGVGLDNGDVHVFSTLLKDDQEQILSKELTFQEPHVISHKKSTKPIRSICFVNGSLVFSGDAAIVWKYSLDLLG